MRGSLRVNQLDASRLDSEISSLLWQQLAEASLLHPGFLERLQPEIEALLRAVLWRFSVCIDVATPGCRLQNLVYSRADAMGTAPKTLARGQKVAFLLLNVLLPWFLARAGDLAERFENAAATGDASASRAHQQLQSVARWYLRRVVPRASTLHSLGAALNFVAFLREGTFASVADRLLGIKLVHLDPSARRQVSDQYMNRVMVWSGFSELLMSIMPLINLARLRDFLTRRVLPKSIRRSLELGAERRCGFCSISPICLPVQSDCGHLFCYFCLGSEQAESHSKVTCPHCSAQIQTFRYAAS